jgi:UPF0288 family protein (methanogenesis marker protein 3)
MNNNNKNETVAPAPVRQIKITLLNNGVITVHGLPANLKMAGRMIAGANEIITGFFVKKAKNGELDEEDNIIQNNPADPIK